MLGRCRQHQVALLVNSQHPLSFARRADGVHWRSQDLAKAGTAGADAGPHETEPADRERWTGASCHSPADLHAAAAIGADFAVLGPVMPTHSHPGQAASGWAGFTEMLALTPIPVYALGGVSRRDLETARQAGAHGVAMIRDLFPG